MFRFLLTYGCIIGFIDFSWGQQNLLPLHSYYKDKLFAPYDSSSLINGSFLPLSESEFNLPDKIRDSSVQYYELTAYICKKHLFEIKGEDCYITISPTVDIVYGKDENEVIQSTKFQNTRGFLVEGDLFKNFSFSSSFYENQARFTNYETNYYNLIGELYPNFISYGTQNAVIPGGGRTKPFKEDGFDYAYAVGNIVYTPFKNIQISAGNNSHFVGSGYRSLLLSDNSFCNPYFRVNVKINSKLSYVYMRAKLLNLMRRPFTTSDESYYETKALSTTYLTYKLSNKCAISLFEGLIWSKGDSITSTPVNPLFYNPIPFVSELVVTDQQTMSSLIGINAEYIVKTKHRFYSQLAMCNFDTKYMGFQLGYRGYNFVRIKDFMFQMEYNYVPKTLYASENRRLNYSHYNLPLAHSKGNGFQEFVFRINYEYQRVYLDVKIISYLLEGYQDASLLTVEKNQVKKYGNLQHNQIELGYRVNRKVNLSFYGCYFLRSDLTSNTTATQFFCIGLRTGLINHYNDF